MVFEGINFIKPNVEFDRTRCDYAPMFRKVFAVEEKVEKAVLTVCGLGYGYYYLNGKVVTPNLFTAPVSNYDKTLWYNRYDITEQIVTGKNVFAVICGNGWYNEPLQTAWNYDTASWRDIPKFILSLEINGNVVLKSDDTWKYTLKTPYIYNQLRVGEIFDSRLYEKNWKALDFDDSSWEFATNDDAPPKGKFRECLCEPIRICKEYKPVDVKKIGDDKYVFDFGINMSGFTRLIVNQPAGERIVLEYAEHLNDDNTINYKGMDDKRFYNDSKFQTDEFICSGEKFTYVPIFTYHGFRYVIVSGLKEVNDDTLTALFVHQDVERKTYFECSNEDLNKLFDMGIQASYSNLFYMPTDCPTREKLGWMNDAQGTAEQMFMDFEAERVYEKWWQDILDSMREDGMLPGIVPTAGWGYEWGNGPVSEGTLFEIPYRIYLHTGDDSLLKRGLPYFKKYNAYLQACKDENGDITYGLDDWASPVKEIKVRNPFINHIFVVKFLKITILALKLAKEDYWETQALLDKEISEIKKKYINDNGECIIDMQTAPAMLIYNDIYDDIEPLKTQLKRLVEKENFHHNCGMVGIRRLYMALNKCGLEDYAYKIITSEGFPSYIAWLRDGGTTLYERWNLTESENHHMYSDFMSWMVKTILGIGVDKNYPGFEKVTINPYFFNELSYAKGYSETVRGKISVEWKRDGDRIKLKVDVPSAIEAYYNGEKLKNGINNITI